MTTNYLENSYEQAIISLFQEKLGYRYIYGFDIERSDYRQPCINNAVHNALTRINAGVPALAIEEAYKRVINMSEGTLLQTNERFMSWLQNGMEKS